MTRCQRLPRLHEHAVTPDLQQNVVFSVAPASFFDPVYQLSDRFRQRRCHSLGNDPQPHVQGSDAGHFGLRVLKVPTVIGDGAETNVDVVGSASIAAVAFSSEAKRTDCLVAVGRLDSSDGSLHDQPRQFTDKAFQASLELVSTGGRDL